MTEPVTRNLDLEPVSVLLRQATGLTTALDHLPIAVNDGRRNTHIAQTNRDLQRLADKLELASNLVRDQLWAVRGHDDITDIILRIDTRRERENGATTT